MFHSLPVFKAEGLGPDKLWHPIRVDACLPGGKSLLFFGLDFGLISIFSAEQREDWDDLNLSKNQFRS